MLQSSHLKGEVVVVFFLIWSLTGGGWWWICLWNPLGNNNPSDHGGNVASKNNGQFISGGKNKINFLSGFSCWSILSNLLVSQRTEVGEVLRSMWYLFAGGGKQSEEQELWWRQRFPLCCTCPGDGVQLRCSWWSTQDVVSWTCRGPECLFPAPGDGAGSDREQLYPGIRLLGESWKVPPRGSLLPLDATEKGGIPA